MATQISKSVVDEDARLEKAADRSTEALAKHRWHWTLDESNPNRVSARQYALAVGRSAATISGHARGYDEWVMGVRPGLTLPDVLALQRFGKDEQPIAAEMSKQTGVGGSGLKQNPKSRQIIKDAHAIAKDRAAANKTSIADEAEGAVKDLLKQERAHERKQEQKRQRHGFRYIKADAALVKARKALVNAIEEIRGVEFTDEERSLLIEEFTRLQTLIPLVSLELQGTSGVDWDAALVSMNEGR
jgi:hypothetical protein